MALWMEFWKVRIWHYLLEFEAFEDEWMEQIADYVPVKGLEPLKNLESYK